RALRSHPRFLAAHQRHSRSSTGIKERDMDIESTKRKARVAGMTYLLLMTAPFSLIYVPNKLMVRGDAAATANNILAHQTMFRLAMVNELLTAVAFIFVGVALY